MALDIDNLKGWYSALDEEDCVKVKELLQKDGNLLNEGWFQVTRASPQIQVQYGWKGRTAVHVAARRGDVDLMELILNRYSQTLCQGKVKGRGCSTYSDLFEAEDTAYRLDALAMAVVNGNKDIVNLLTKSSLESDSLSTLSNNSDDDETEDRSTRRDDDETEDGSTRHEDRETKATQVRKITEEILGDCQKYPNVTRLQKWYSKDCDFNFLEINLYFFHFTFSTWRKTEDLELIQRAIFTQARKDNVLEYLLFELWDGQGRTPLHAAVDAQLVNRFLRIIPSPGKDVNLGDDYLNKTDRAGRTPLYRAAARNFYLTVKYLLNDPRTNVLAKTICSAKQWGAAVDIDKLSLKNGFKSDCVYVPNEKLRRNAFNKKSKPGNSILPLEEISSTALHVAIIHGQKRIVEVLLDPRWRPEIEARIRMVANDAVERSMKEAQVQPNVPCVRRFTWPASLMVHSDDAGYGFQRSATPMELTVLVGKSIILHRLLKENNDQGRSDVEASFQLAASTGKPTMIERFLDLERGRFNPLITDSLHNTALHHAVRGKNIHQVHPHLVDFVGCDHVYVSRRQSDSVSQWLANPEEASSERKAVGEDENVELQTKYGQRMRSINLLLDAGIDLWERNRDQRMATPESDACDEFVRWWYAKVSQETQGVQQKLNAAANAISVTAALVATASYVGPLQPPLGYDDASGVQVNILAVRIFVVCNSLSFYLALAAIMLALLPSLPLSRDSVFRELARTRVFVAISVAFLFPSIICVLLAFAAGYAAVIPDHGLAYRGLTMGTTVVGGFVCLLVMRFFASRLLKVLLETPIDIKGKIRGDWLKIRGKIRTLPQDLFLLGRKIVTFSRDLFLPSPSPSQGAS